MLGKQSPEDIPHVPIAFARRTFEPLAIDDANLSTSLRKDAPADEIGKNKRDCWTSKTEDVGKSLLSEEKFVAGQAILSA